MQGDLKPNVYRTRSSLDKDKVDNAIQSLPAPPRRSGRLSIAREQLAASTTIENKECTQNLIKFRRGKSLDADSLQQKHPVTDPSTKKPLAEQPIKRPRSMKNILPKLPVSRTASRRLQDEFEEVPAKRARLDIIEILNTQDKICSQEHHNLSLTNFEPTKYTAGFSPYDISNRGDVLQSPEYVSDIFQRLYHSEVRFLNHF